MSLRISQWKIQGHGVWIWNSLDRSFFQIQIQNLEEKKKRVWHGKPDLANETNKGTDHWFSNNDMIVYGKIWTRTWQFNHQRAGKEPEMEESTTAESQSGSRADSSLYLSVQYWDCVVIFFPQACNDTSHHVGDRLSHTVLIWTFL